MQVVTIGANLHGMLNLFLGISKKKYFKKSSDGIFISILCVKQYFLSYYFEDENISEPNHWVLCLQGIGAFAENEGSDQPLRPCHLIMAFAHRLQYHWLLRTMLELPHQGGSNEYPQSVLSRKGEAVLMSTHNLCLSRNMKNIRIFV